MALRFDSPRRFGGLGFGALDADQIARMDAVVSQARDSWAQADSLVPDPLTRGLDYIIGASSSVQALQSNAAAAKTLYDVLQAKRNRLASDPNATEADVVGMESSGYALSNQAAIEAAQQLSAEAFYDQVIVQTGEDVANVAKNPFGVPWWAWVAGAGALALLILVPRRR
jgi:hypothetical protein